MGSLYSRWENCKISADSLQAIQSSSPFKAFPGFSELNLRSPKDMEIAPKTCQDNGPSSKMTPQVGVQLQKIIDQTYAKFKNVDDGTVATYIPELRKANPNDFGI